MKLEPVTVRMKEALPGATEVGDNDVGVRTGNGLGGGLMMKASGLERPLSCEPEWGLKVLTLTLPGVVVSAAGTTAVRFRMLLLASVTTVVARFLPFH